MKIKGKTFTATEFKAKCLRILDDLEPQGIIILKRGRPVAKVMPIAGMTCLSKVAPFRMAPLPGSDWSCNRSYDMLEVL